MKRLFFGIIGGAALLAVIFPRHEKLTESYQTSLWTYPSSAKQLTFHAKPPDLCLRVGGLIPGNRIVHWERFRCGLPLAAITADFQAQSRILQVRAELAFVALNVGCGASVGFVVFLLLQRTLIARGQKLAEQAGDGDA